MQNVLITGIGSGLGEALAKAYLERGDKVYAIGREFPKQFDHYNNFVFFPYDLSKTFLIHSDIQPFIQHHDFDIVILNAGVLGRIDVMKNIDLQDIKEVMEINVWANKELIDVLSAYATVKQVIGISSGAAVNGSKGWGAYALSKSALNMLLKIYANELPGIHFTALAPGIIKTPMTDKIIEKVDETEFPSAKTLKESYIQSPEEAAKNLLYLFPKLLEYESGSFVDVREM